MKLIQNAVLGNLITTLTDEGYRCEVTTLACGDGTFIYAHPDNGHMPKTGATHWVRINYSGITDYSVNLEDALTPVIAYTESLRNVFED